jgi:hypothetical protein
VSDGKTPALFFADILCVISIMPLTRGRDKTGAYYRWGAAGRGGTKYHYTAKNKASRERAKLKAMSSAAPSPKKKTGGRTPRKPKKKTITSASGAKNKLNNKARVADTVTYRRPRATNRV